VLFPHLFATKPSLEAERLSLFDWAKSGIRSSRSPSSFLDPEKGPMTPGSLYRRTATGFAALTIAALAGCHAGPVARVAPMANRPQSALASAGRAALLPATVAMEPPAEMSSIEPVSSGANTEPSPGRLELPKVATAPQAPTPLLDAALEKARGIEAMVAEEMAKPPTPPNPTATPSPSPPADPPRAVPVAAAPAEAPREARPAEPPRPEELWRDGVRKLAGLARARLDQPDGPGSTWGLRARVLAWLSEPDIDPDLGQHEADGVRAVLRALGDAPAEAPRRGDEVRTAVMVLEDRAPLEIVDLRLCSKVERFGDFETFDPPVRKAGQAVVIYSEVDGLHYEPTSAGFRTRLTAQVEIVPEGGGPPVLTRALGTADEVCRRRRRDYCIAYLLILPKSLPTGGYRLRLTHKDLTADRSATREVAFAIARE